MKMGTTTAPGTYECNQAEVSGYCPHGYAANDCRYCDDGTADDGWTFAQIDDVIQFAHDAEPGFSQIDSRVIVDLFNASAIDYEQTYTWEDPALVDFYDALTTAWKAL